MAIDRIKELEKIADRLGIGKDRDVECISCKKTFRFKEAVILTDGQETKYLCKTCLGELKEGKLNKENEWLDVLDDLKKASKPAPWISPSGTGTFVPKKFDPPIWEAPYEIGDDYKTTYTVSASEDDKILALRPMIVENKTQHGN